MIKINNYISKIEINQDGVKTVTILRILKITTETILDLISSDVLTCMKKIIFTSVRHRKTSFLSYPNHYLIKINKLSLQDLSRYSRINEIFHFNVSLYNDSIFKEK